MDTDRYRLAVGRHLLVCLLAVLTMLTATTVDPDLARADVTTDKSAPAQDVTFGIQAASAAHADQRPNFTYGGGPGAAPFHDYVSILNVGPTPLVLSLYSADAQSTANGQFSLKLQSDQQNEVGSWITFAAGPKVTVPAQTQAGPGRIFVPFTLKIPPTATPGDHAGAILVSLHTAAGTGAQTGEALDQRVGIRVYVRVSGTVHALLAVQHLKSSFTPFIEANPLGKGTMSVSYVVANVGNVILGANQTVAASGLLGGTKRSGALAQIPAMLPGTSTTVHATITGVLPEFRESVKVKLQPLAPVGSADPAVTTVAASTSTWAVPWTLLVLVIVVGAATTWYLRRRLTPSGSHNHRKAPLVGAHR